MKNGNSSTAVEADRKSAAAGIHTRRTRSGVVRWWCSPLPRLQAQTERQASSKDKAEGMRHYV